MGILPRSLTARKTGAISPSIPESSPSSSLGQRMGALKSAARSGSRRGALGRCRDLDSMSRTRSIDWPIVRPAVTFDETAEPHSRLVAEAIHEHSNRDRVVLL